MTKIDVPHDLQAEEAVLRAVLSSDGMSVVADRLDATDFYAEAYRWVFQAARDVWAAGKRVNSISVRARLSELHKAGALNDDTLTDIMARTGFRHADDLRACADRVRMLSRDRGLLEKLQRATAELRHGVADRDAFYGTLEAAMHGAQDASSEGDSVSVRDALAQAFHDLRNARPGKLRGLSSGFAGLDDLLCGLCPGDLTVLAGRPGCCKTALSLQIATNVARNGSGVVFHTLEMGPSEIANRMLCAQAMADARAPYRGGWLPEEFTRVAGVASELSTLATMRIDARPLTPASLRMRAKREQARYKAAGIKMGLLVVDYFQLLKMPGGDESEALKLERAIQDAKNLAMEMGVHVLALSQLSREVEKRGGRRPVLSDLRGSGGIEQAANNVLFIHRGEKEREGLETELAEVIVAKQRNGPIGTVYMQLHRASTHFRDATPDEVEEYGAREQAKPERAW